MEIIRSNWDLYKAIYADWFSWLKADSEDAVLLEDAEETPNKKREKIAEDSFIWKYMRDTMCMEEAEQLIERMMDPDLELAMILEGRYKKYSRLLVLDCLLAGRKITIEEYEKYWQVLKLGGDDLLAIHKDRLTEQRMIDQEYESDRDSYGEQEGACRRPGLDSKLMNRVNRILSQDPASRKLLRTAVNDFFTKNGLNKKILEADAVNSSKKGQSLYEDEVQLYHAFSIYQSQLQGIRIDSSSDTMGAEGIWPDVDACERLYQRLRRLEWAEDMILPLRLDSAMGSGVYLVGRSCFEEAVEEMPEVVPETVKNGIEDDSCFVCVLSFYMIDPSSDNLEYDRGSGSFSLKIASEYRVIEDSKGTEDAVHKAYEYLLGDRRNRYMDQNPWLEDLAEDQDEIYQLIPDSLRKYFNSEAAPVSPSEEYIMEQQEQTMKEANQKADQMKRRNLQAYKEHKARLGQ